MGIPRDRPRRRPLGPWRRWQSTAAASDTVSLSTWILVAVALAVFVVALVATPNDPVRAWLHTALDQAPTISSVQGSPNPSGAEGVQDWNVSNGDASAVRAGSFDGAIALQWSNTEAGYHWIWEYVAVSNLATYRFSVELTGSGIAWLNVWNGSQNIPAAPIYLSGAWQTESLITTIHEGSGNFSPPEIQVASTDPGTVVDVQQAVVVPD